VSTPLTMHLKMHFGCRSAEGSSVLIQFCCKDHQLLNKLISSIKQFCKKQRHSPALLSSQSDQ